jgi:hypothetical protein
MIGKCSEFGGPHDEVMRKDSGLAFYEPWEADRRPDMFYPEDLGWIKEHPEWAALYPNGDRQPTWARLKVEFFYIALRCDSSLSRAVFQNTPFKIKNCETGDWVCGFLVDRGPGVVDRLVDLSPGIMKKLNLKTDDLVEVTQLSTR